MSGLNTALTIGMQALQASESALNTASNNISNSSTPGYTRERVVETANSESLVGGEFTGGGVTVDQIASTRDELLNVQIQQQTSAQGSVNTQSAILQQLQTYFTTGNSDISSGFSALSSALISLSGSPTNSAVQDSVIGAGQQLAQAFNSTAAGLSSGQSDADGEVTDTVAQINSLGHQIAALNGELAQSGSSSQNGGTIEDQRDELVQQLSSMVGVSITQGSNGETITIGNGTPLVMGSQSFNLQTAIGSDGFHTVLDSNGNDITSQIQGGQLGGAIQVRDQTIPGYLEQLNTLANQLAAGFNSAQAEGTDSNGNTGQPFFSLPANAQKAAAGIRVALTDPTQVAISSNGSGASNGNVANLSAVLTTDLPSGQTPADAYANLVFQVGQDASDASANSSAIGQNLLQLQNQQGSVSGVSIDEETASLIQYQTAYEAAARIVSTIQQLNTVTLDMGASQSY